MKASNAIAISVHPYIDNDEGSLEQKPSSVNPSPRNVLECLPADQFSVQLIEAGTGSATGWPLVDSERNANFCHFKASKSPKFRAF